MFGGQAWGEGELRVRRGRVAPSTAIVVLTPGLTSAPVVGALIIERIDAAADVDEAVCGALGVQRRRVGRKAHDNLGPDAKLTAADDAIHLKCPYDGRLVRHLDAKEGEGAVVLGGARRYLLDLEHRGADGRGVQVAHDA
jgi:hypothetical protein